MSKTIDGIELEENQHYVLYYSGHAAAKAPQPPKKYDGWVRNGDIHFGTEGRQFPVDCLFYWWDNAREDFLGRLRVNLGEGSEPVYECLVK